MKIALYLNFDMIGSPNFARLIYDGDGSAFEIPGPKGSDKIEKTSARHFKRADLATEEIAFDGRSDYLAVHRRRDPCRRPLCDNVDNVSRKALKQMTPAVADAVARYSVSTDSLGGGKKGGGGKDRAADAQSEYLGNHLAR